MIDKGHCVMNDDDEEEYDDYYDYSLSEQYLNIPKKPEAIEEDKAREALWAAEAAKAGTIPEEDDWSDCDEEDGAPEKPDQPKEAETEVSED
jgi:hypothetical protein